MFYRQQADGILGVQRSSTGRMPTLLTSLVVVVYAASVASRVSQASAGTAAARGATSMIRTVALTLRLLRTVPSIARLPSHLFDDRSQVRKALRQRVGQNKRRFIDIEAGFE